MHLFTLVGFLKLNIPQAAPGYFELSIQENRVMRRIAFQTPLISDEVQVKPLPGIQDLQKRFVCLCFCFLILFYLKNTGV